MATRFGIRNASRSGNSITFTLVALNADGTVDTAYAGTAQFDLNGATGPVTTMFTPADAGMRVFSATATLSTVVIEASQAGSAGAIRAQLFFSAPAGSFASPTATGDNVLFGGAGNDTLSTLGGNDLFLLGGGGNDAVDGGGGDDGFYFGAAFGAGDSVNGGAGGNDQVALQGNYSALTLLPASQFSGVEAFALLAGDVTDFGDPGTDSYSYNLALTGAWSGNTIFNANSLRVGERLDFDANGTTAGTFTVFAGLGIKRLSGGVGNDGFFFRAGTFDPANTFVNGDGGTDNQVGLRGNFSSGLAFDAVSLVNIQTIAVISSQDPQYAPSATPFSYSLTLDDGNVTGTNQLTITGTGLRSNEQLSINGSAETTGSLRLIGGAGSDTLLGGGGNDLFFGGRGGDFMFGFGGADTFFYTDLNQTPLTGVMDEIGGFGADDVIDVSALDANTMLPGNQDFAFIGSAAFSGAAQQFRLFNTGPNEWQVQADVDGDAIADFDILLGVTPGYTPTQADFVGVIQ